METIQIIIANTSHVSDLTKIAVETFSEAFAHHNNPRDFAEYLSSAFNENQIEKELLEEGSTYLLAYHQGELAGYARLRQSVEGNEKFQSVRNIELQRIYSYQKFIGKGVGKTLLQFGMDYARKAGYEIMWLGVWEHNPHALSFYKHFGFTAFDSHVFMLGQDAQTDILMKKKLV